MKILANRQSLLNALALACQAVPARPFKPVLQNVLLTAGQDRCTIYATDMEVAVKAEFSAQVDRGGSVLAPAALLRTILGVSTDDQIMLEVSGQTLHVRAARFKHQIPTAKTDEFPAIAPVEWASVIEVPGAFFSTCIKAVSPQADQTDSRYALHCVLFELSERSLAIVATDGRVMAAAEMPVDSEKTAQALVTLRASRIIASIDSDLPRKVSFSSNWIAAESGGTLVMARLGEGRFPRWRELLQSEPSPKLSATVIPSQLILLIRQTCVAAQDPSAGSPKATVTFKDGDLGMQCSASGIESESSIPCAMTGEKSWSVNWKYLLEVATCLSLFDDLPVNVTAGDDKNQELMLFVRDNVRCVIVPLT